MGNTTIKLKNLIDTVAHSTNTQYLFYPGEPEATTKYRCPRFRHIIGGNVVVQASTLSSTIKSLVIRYAPVIRRSGTAVSMSSIGVTKSITAGGYWTIKVPTDVTDTTLMSADGFELYVSAGTWGGASVNLTVCADFKVDY